ncbi:MAG: iron ABC transporter permease [Pseudomonadales bacterium]|nr:iron ABC transporter permease [Pseudomonadales bacterium]
MLVGLVLSLVLAVGHGAVSIAAEAQLRMLLQAIGLGAGAAVDPLQHTVFFAIRLPRALLAVLVGGALAVCGASLQGLFRNPLADPGLIGVSTGAALAAAFAIVLGGTLAPALALSLSAWLLPLAAFVGGLGATALVFIIASRSGICDVPTMLLAGVAVNAIAGAAIGLLVFLSDDAQLRELSFWMLGSLSGITWTRLLPALPLLLVPTVLLLRLGHPLNALLLGEQDAGHLGVRVERVKRSAILLVSLAVGAAVALTGVIGFVGLVVPHLVRLLLGPDHRVLLPASALAGAALLLLADVLARTLVLPAELPIGILTSCVGGPFFLWLLCRPREPGRL